MDLKALYTSADSVSSKFINNLNDQTDWNRDSILPGWGIGTLINHLVGENLWTPEILSGKTTDEVGDKFDGDLLDGDPKKAWAESSEKAKIAVLNLDDLEKTVHLSYADVEASDYLSQRIMDMTIHGWDLAKSTNQEDTLPEDLLQFIWDYASPREEELRESGLFGNHIDVEEDSDLQTKVLALLGRKKD